MTGQAASPYPQVPAPDAPPTEPPEPPEPPAEPELPLLSEPADGVPEPLTDSAGLATYTRAVAAGHGPVAVDAERASGYRYSQRAYLVQLRRDTAGTALIDPIALPALSELNAAIGDAEWILHAAGQDLACLAELGLHPAGLFDTELAGRLLGYERVALGTMVERHLGVRLRKEHSAADWSTRPLPQEWLNYASLDVELLIPLRDVLADALTAAGKDEWAAQEFEAIRITPAPGRRSDPWRRTSGIHKVRNRRQLAVVRELWQARDQHAATRDLAPGRVLPDAAIIDAARAQPTTRDALVAIGVFGGPRQRRQADRWLGAIRGALRVPEQELPPLAVNSPGGLPPVSRWREREPAAAARLAAARAAVAEIAERHQVLSQNLLAADVIRHLAWTPPAARTGAVAQRLAELGARPWQVSLTAAPLAAALAQTPAD